MNYLELKKIRKTNNLNQKEMANYLLISLRKYQYLESGEHEIEDDIVKMIKDFVANNANNVSNENAKKDKELRILALEAVKYWEELMQVDTFRSKFYEQLGKTLNVDLDEIIKNGVLSVLKKKS